jgi:hypothetical protein
MSEYFCKKDDCEYSGNFRGLSLHYSKKHGEKLNKKSYLIEDLHRLNEEFETITKQLINDESKYSSGLYTKVFGGLNKALKEAGLEINQHTNVSDDFIKTELRKVEEKCGECTYQTVKEHAKISPDLCRNRFGTFENAVISAGVESQKQNRPQRHDLIKEIKRISYLVGYSPTVTDIKIYSKYSLSPFIREFGSWNESLQYVDYESRHSKNHIPLHIKKTGEDSTAWRGGKTVYYGREWEGLREKALERANYTCEHPSCDKRESESGRGLDCHHIIPNSLTENEKEHNLDNLIMLCQKHHKELEPLKEWTEPL